MADETETPEEAVAAPAEAQPEEPESVQTIRKINRGIGLGEQALLVGFLATLIGVATLQVIANKFFDKGWPWTFEFIRNSVFLIAMTGAALTAQADKMLSMDFVTRIVKPRTSAYLRAATRLFTIVICLLLAYGGVILARSMEAEEYEILKPAKIMLALPLGSGIIALHTLFYLAIDVVYLSRGEITPEQNQLSTAEK